MRTPATVLPDAVDSTIPTRLREAVADTGAAVPDTIQESIPDAIQGPIPDVRLSRRDVLVLTGAALALGAGVAVYRGRAPPAGYGVGGVDDRGYGLAIGYVQTRL